MPFLQEGMIDSVTVPAGQSIRVGAPMQAVAIVTLPAGLSGGPLTVVTNNTALLGPYPAGATISVRASRGVVEYAVGAAPQTGQAVTFANRPTSAVIGEPFRLTDIGPGAGSMMMWDGARLASNFYQVFAASNIASAVHTGTTAKTAIVSLVLPGGLLGPNGDLLFSFRSTGVGAGAKLWNLTLGPTDLFHAGPSGATFQGGECNISNRGSEAVQIGSALNLQGQANSGVNNLLLSTVDTSVDQNLVINATLASGADSLTLQAWRIMFLSRS